MNSPWNHLPSSLLRAGLLVALVSVTSALAPRPVEATLICRQGSGRCMFIAISLEGCNNVWRALGSPPNYACFAMSTNPGDSNSGTGPHLLRHRNGEVSLVANGKTSLIVFANADASKQFADLPAKARQSGEPGRPAPQGTDDRGRRGGIDPKAEPRALLDSFFDVFVEIGIRTASDAQLQQLSRELNLPIRTEGPRS